MNNEKSFVPPPYPHDQLNDLKELAISIYGDVIDLSIGSPCDPPSQFYLDHLNNPELAKAYPPSQGSLQFRNAATNWLNRLTNCGITAENVAATIGSKEFVAGLPHWLKLRSPKKNIVLYPEVSYPSYAMGARLANCEAVAVPLDENWHLDISHVDSSILDRVLCLWVNSPGNPAGGIDDLEQIVNWGIENDVLIVSDECYIEFTWGEQPKSALEYSKNGVLSVHSLSKRSNFAGLRSGFYAGDPELVHYLSEVRKHAGFMQPGPVMSAAIAAFNDEFEPQKQKQIYLERMQLLQAVFATLGFEVSLPEGGFYLWVKSQTGDGWDFSKYLAEKLGILVSPGDFYGQASKSFVRVAAVQPTEKIEILADRVQN